MSIFTKESLAARLHVRKMGHEITWDEEAEAALSNLVVLFGYSDDNAEFRGAIQDEVGCGGGDIILISGRRAEVLNSYHARFCECSHCGYAEFVKSAQQIKALWCANHDCSWTFSTDIPHATFDIMEGTEKFCRGIVFELPQ